MLIEVKQLHRTEKTVITLLIDQESGKRYVRRCLSGVHPAYEQLKKLPHPYLPRIESVEQCDGDTIILEEYIEGANLAEVTLPEKQVVTLMEELCEVLAFLHGHGILHRDVKPSNLLLAPDGHIRLIDFDAAREEKPDSDSDTRLLGTKGYAPPEQYGFAQTDARADIYAAGVTMKQLLGKAAEKRVYRHILRKCTEFAPKRRYTTVEALRRALKMRWVWLVLSWVVPLAVVLGVAGAVWWNVTDRAEVVEMRYPDEELLFYAVDADYVIAKVGDLRQNGESMLMSLDLDGDRKKEEIQLLGIGNGSDELYAPLTVGTADGNWVELLGWTIYNTSMWERLKCEPYGSTNLPDEYYIQITCLDLNPMDADGMEIVVSVGDLASESVCAVYHYTGAAYEGPGEPYPADYMGRMWGGANFKVDSNLNPGSELQHNPYQDWNTYLYDHEGVHQSWEGEADYEKYRHAADGNLNLWEWYEALNE